MKERAVAMEKTRSLENLHELRLMALLLDVIREKGRMEAADLLGVNYKTLARAVETGSLSPRMSHALDRLLLSRESKAMAAQQERIAALEGRVEGLEQKIKSSLGKVRAFVEGQVKALGEEHTRGRCASWSDGWLRSGPGRGRGAGLMRFASRLVIPRFGGSIPSWCLGICSTPCSRRCGTVRPRSRDPHGWAASSC